MKWRLRGSAGYTASDVIGIKQELNEYTDLREAIRQASGEKLDLKPFEADMRHLIDTYIEADEPRKISPLDNVPLLELIVMIGISDMVNRLPKSIRADPIAVAETIENNVRSKINTEYLNNPAFYERISKLLDEVIKQRKARAVSYEEYLKNIAVVVGKVAKGHAEGLPEQINTKGRRSLYDNLNQNEDLAIRIDEAIKTNRPDAWRDVPAREKTIKRLLMEQLHNESEVERIFVTIKSLKDEY